MEEKIKRNTQIFFDKYGFRNDNEVKKVKPTGVGISYRELGEKYKLSGTFLQQVIKRTMRRFEKKFRLKLEDKLKQLYVKK